MAISLKKLRDAVHVAKAPQHETFLSLVQHVTDDGDQRYDVVKVCMCCGNGVIVQDNVKASHLTHAKQTRDMLAQCINALSGLSLNCNLSEEKRETLLKLATDADRHLDVIDGCDKF